MILAEATLEARTTSHSFPFNVVVIGGEEGMRLTVERHLANRFAYVEARYPSLESALAQPLEQSELRLYVALVPDPQAIVQLRHLSGQISSQPILAVVPENATRDEVFQVMRAGAMQIVAMPAEDPDFGAALDWFAIHFGFHAKTTQVIAVAGSTGGCGASTLAVNLATEFASQHKRQCILTEISTTGTLANYLDLKPQYTTHDLFNTPGYDLYQVRSSLTRVMDNLDLLPSVSDSIRLESVDSAQAAQLLSMLRRLTDMVVVDVPCEFNDLFFATLASANQVILVANQTLASVRNIRMIREALSRDSGGPVPTIVVNKYDAQDNAFSRTARESLLKIPELFTVASDPAVKMSVDEGVPLRRRAPRSPAMADIDKLARAVLHLKQEGPVGLFHRTLRVLGLSSRSLS